MAATHPPSGTGVQEAPPSRVIRSTPPPLTQPTFAVGKTMVGVASGEKSATGAGSLPPMTLHVLPPLLVRTSRGPQPELWDHTPRPVVALRNVIAERLAGATDVELQTARLAVTTACVVVVLAGVVVDVPVEDVDDVDSGDAEVVQAARVSADINVTRVRVRTLTGPATRLRRHRGTTTAANLTPRISLVQGHSRPVTTLGVRCSQAPS